MAATNETRTLFTQVGMAPLYCSHTLRPSGSKEPHIRAFKGGIICSKFPVVAEKFDKNHQKTRLKNPSLKTYLQLGANETAPLPSYEAKGHGLYFTWWPQQI